MDKQIRRLGITLMVLFVALFVQLNVVQVVQADKLANDPRNTRAIVRDFSRKRGTISTADGVLLAQSVPATDAFKLQRVYPQKDLYAQITGYFSFTYGTDGVEKTYNDDLAGRSAPLRRLLDFRKDPDNTGNLTLTLKNAVQTVARQALGNRKGAVVALNPTDGSVLALWSWPSFDPNGLASHDTNAVRDYWDAANKDANKPLLDRAYRERYFPGSTFKVVTSAAALTVPDIANRTYPTLTALELPQTNHQKLANFGNERCGGQLPQLLKVSCNTGFAQIGIDLGAGKLTDEARSFGFFDRPPLDLPGVAKSLFPAADAFAHDIPGLAKSAIGQQDVQATPLQMALVAAAVANGGTIMKPHVLQTIRDAEGAVIKQVGPEPWRQPMSPDEAATLRDMMVGVVTGGTARGASIPGVAVAAKTGTAQTGTANTSHAWLIAFAPAEAPKVAVAVIVEAQTGVGDAATGGRVAAPIAQAVMKAALSAP